MRALNILTLKGIDSDILDSGTLRFELVNSFDVKRFVIDQNVVVVIPEA